MCWSKKRPAVARGQIHRALCRPERVVPSRLREGDVPSVELIDQPQLGLASFQGRCVGEPAAEHLQRELLLDGEPGLRQGDQLAADLRQRLPELPERVGRQIVELRVETMVSQRRGGERAATQEGKRGGVERDRPVPAREPVEERGRALR